MRATSEAMLEAVLLRSSVAHDAPRWCSSSHTKLAYCETLARSLSGQKRCDYGFAVALIYVLIA